MTRIFIAADIEGCTGVVHLDQLMEGQPRYQAARKLMTADINAAIAGAREVDPEATFIVCDGHAAMRNIILEELDPAAELVIGSSRPDNKPLCQCEGIDPDHDMVFLVGFHSRSDTRPGLLSHTLAGTHIKRFLINGLEVGEAAIAEAICASYGAPVTLVVGNHELETELADTLMPGYQFVATKRTLGPTAALCKTPARTWQEIAAAAGRAVRAFREQPPQVRRFSADVTMTVHAHHAEFVRKALASSEVHRLDDYTFEATAVDAAECFRRIWHGIYLGLLQAPEWLT
jgi:D-amino peptidase